MARLTLHDWVPLLVEETKQRLRVTELVDVANDVFLGHAGLLLLAKHIEILATDSGQPHISVRPVVYVLEDGSLLVSATCAAGAFAFRVEPNTWSWCRSSADPQ